MSNNVFSVLSNGASTSGLQQVGASRSHLAKPVFIHPTVNRSAQVSIVVPNIRAPSLREFDRIDRTNQLAESTILHNGDVKVTRELSWSLRPVFKVVVEDGKEIKLDVGDTVVVSKDRVVIETGNSADSVKVSLSASGGVDVNINGKIFQINNNEQDPKVREILIKTHGGNDSIVIDPAVKERIRVEAGSGDDYVRAGSGETRVLGGSGNDCIWLGSGVGYAQGDDGDDTLISGAGPSALYGNDGNDKIYAGYCVNSPRTYMDGGRGDDKLYSKTGKTVMHGGQGNDLMVSAGHSHIYTGTGTDTVETAGADTIFSQGKNNITPGTTSKVVEVAESSAGSKAFVIKGSAEFKRRVQDDIDFLNASPTGQKMLAKMDATANPEIKISELDMDWGYFEALDRSIGYNPSFNAQVIGAEPVVVLFHEMAHAYNVSTNSTLPGYTRVGNGEPGLEPNIERQAVGLWTNAEPLDFDNDPSTPSTSTNPVEFSENGMRAEIGIPLRKAYSIKNIA